MDAVSASGLGALRSATARLQSAADQIGRVRPMTIPAASSQDAVQTRAVAGQSLAPPPPAEPGGRAPSPSDYVDASLSMIRAGQEARLGAALIKAGDEMARTLLDIKV